MPKKPKKDSVSRAIIDCFNIVEAAKRGDIDFINNWVEQNKQ